jgi:AraC-like DNA-binding protein
MVYFDNLKQNQPFSISQRIGKMHEHDLHFHDLLEIGVITKNEVRYQFEDKDIHGQAGDVFLCRPFEAHWSYLKDRSNPYHFILVLFSPSALLSVPMGFRLLIPFYSTRMIFPLISANSDCAKAIQRAAVRAVQEEEEQSIVWETKQFLLFLEILTHVYTYYVKHCQSELPGDSDYAVITAISFILSNITEELSAEEIAESSQLGKTWFYRKFKWMTGLSPNHFINRIRLQIAADRLHRTSKRVTDIAMESGFSSLRTFNTQFKHRYQMSPTDYRDMKQR